MNDSQPTLLWDGEWEVTYVTFRDMGAAFIVAILGIYLLVVAQFGSFRLPLVILIPVPLTLIGIVLGHWLLGAAFTATSMIGFIALAGIIRRRRDDRRGLHSRRSDLPGPRHLARLRSRLVDRAHRTGHPGDLCLAQGRRTAGEDEGLNRRFAR